MTKRHVSTLVVVFIGLMLAGCAAEVAPEETSGPAVTSGRVAESSPFALPSLTASGDLPVSRLAHSRQMLVHVPEGYELPLPVRWTEDQELVLEMEGESARTIGVKVDWTYRDDEKVFLNPLLDMTADEIRGLWGILLEHWSDQIGEQLQDIDPERTCLTLTHDAAVEPDGAFPPLPAGTRYVVVRINSSNDPFTDYSALRSLKDLRSFQFGGATREAFDVSVLHAAAQLEDLGLAGEDFQDVADLGGFANLRRLDLRWCRELSGVDFATNLSALEAINVSQTGVTDLTPLADLEQLKYVDADLSPVTKLPDGEMSALRTLRLQSTKLDDAAVKQFAQANPACNVLYRWVDSLQATLGDATRLRIRSGGTCHRNLEEEETLFETKDRATIDQLLAGIVIDEKESGVHCMCCGDPSLEFYRGNELIATLGFHHGQSLRWPGGWPGDAMLTSKSADFLCRWLEAQGIEVEE